MSFAYSNPELQLYNQTFRFLNVIVSNVSSISEETVGLIFRDFQHVSQSIPVVLELTFWDLDLTKVQPFSHALICETAEHIVPVSLV